MHICMQSLANDMQIMSGILKKQTPACHVELHDLQFAVKRRVMGGNAMQLLAPSKDISAGILLKEWHQMEDK